MTEDDEDNYTLYRNALIAILIGNAILQSYIISLYSKYTFTNVFAVVGGLFVVLAILWISAPKITSTTPPDQESK